MLDGKRGFPAQQAMEILVALGETEDATEMIPVKSVHLPGTAIISARDAGVAWVQELCDKGGKFTVFADSNMTSHDYHDPIAWRELGIPEDFVMKDKKHLRNLQKMGAYLCNTCTPYLIGHVPSFGEDVAWGESSAISFVNSVLGARTNRQGGPSALAAALTGRVPKLGYHLKENRYGDIKIKVNVELKGLLEYNSLGYFAGKLAHGGIPVFTGIPHDAPWEGLKALGASASTSGSVALYHAVGRTPEAPTEEAAFGGKKIGSSSIFEFGPREMREIEESLDDAKTNEVDLVVLGCPEMSISELREAASLLDGKKIKSELWLLASTVMKSYAERLGYLQIIEKSGARVCPGSCPGGRPRGHLAKQGYRTGATPSPKIAFYTGESQDILFHYGSTEHCVQAAIDGVWR